MVSQFAKPLRKRLKKPNSQVSQVFKSNGLKINIDAKKKIVNFLDVTFNLTNGSYKPCIKPNYKLLYVHQQSNHPPALLKNIPLNINKRLTTISSSKEIFDQPIAPYQKALKESGYDHKLIYNPSQKFFFIFFKNKRKRLKHVKAWFVPGCRPPRRNFLFPMGSNGF